MIRKVSSFKGFQWGDPNLRYGFGVLGFLLDQALTCGSSLGVINIMTTPPRNKIGFHIRFEIYVSSEDMGLRSTLSYQSQFMLFHTFDVTAQKKNLRTSRRWQLKVGFEVGDADLFGRLLRLQQGLYLSSGYSANKVRLFGFGCSKESCRSSKSKSLQASKPYKYNLIP